MTVRLIPLIGADGVTSTPSAPGLITGPPAA
jgi:hypothetical protein